MTTLAMGSDGANALQTAIQKALAERGYSPEDDTVMAEYITIMLINDKSPATVTTELTELIGEETYDPEFTNWLFDAKADASAETAPATETSNQSSAFEAPLPVSNEAAASSSGPSRSQSNGRQNTRMYQQAISSLPGSSGNAGGASPGQKRTASQRSPSPSNGPPSAKRRQADLPDRPRAMRDDGTPAGTSRPGRTSLLDRVGPRQGPGHHQANDHVQERIRAVTQTQPGNNMHPQQMMQGGFPPNMDPAAMAMMQQQGGFNPAMMGMGGLETTMMVLQQFGQLAAQMGLVPGAMPMNGPGMMQGQPGMNGQGGPGGFQGDRNRRNGPGGFSKNRPPTNGSPAPHSVQQNAIMPAPPQPSAAVVTTLSPSAAPFAPAATPSNVPTRPLSPTICKFLVNCTNPTCRYSHPSPVATMESGVVLSVEPCEQGLDCVDKDCLKAHVSKAAKNPSAAKPAPAPSQRPAPAPSSSALNTPCKYDPHCTRPNCPYTHVQNKYKAKSSATQCRFGTACTRADCTFAHPPGRVLPNQFSKGLSGAAPTTIHQKATDKETWNKSVDFRNKPAPAAAATGSAEKDTSAAAPATTEAAPVAS